VIIAEGFVVACRLRLKSMQTVQNTFDPIAANC
jgi:hypothetical protein